MALSEQEQRALREIERSLMNDDPKFGASVSGDGFGGSSGAVTLRGIAVIVIGLVMLVGGVALSQQTLAFVALSIVGFLVMLGGAVWMLRSSAKPGASLGSFGQQAPSQKKQRNTGGLADRMEENFRRRFEQ